MQYIPDIVIADRSGAVAAIVVVKALNGNGAQTATRYMRNLFAHGDMPHTRFVMLITSDMGYLWRTTDEVFRKTLPSLAFPMGGIVRYYLPPDDGSSPVRGVVLESIARQWLLDLADGISPDDRVTTTLRESGFLDVVRNGQVNVHVPV